jgi:hypothetical protein
MPAGKQAAPKFTPPFGYGEVEPLQKTHRVRLPAAGATPKFCRSVNALPLSVSEFSTAARDYPIVFASATAGGPYAPIVVLGLADAQNLFVDAAGAWDSTAYVPAYLRRHPFCIATLQVEDVQRSEKVVCVASTHLDRRGARLFDADGAATPQWQAAQRLLQEYENDLEVTARMCALFAQLDLFAPFSFQVTQNEAPDLKLQGMHRIDEQKLKALQPARLKALLDEGWMGKIYAHIHSLENFARLYQRAVARARTPAKPKKKAKPK